jgi:hypothetical protein
MIMGEVGFCFANEIVILTKVRSLCICWGSLDKEDRRLPLSCVAPKTQHYLG